MATDILAPEVLQTMGRDLSVQQLIRAAETFKQTGQLNSLDALYSAWIQHNQAHPLLYAILFNYSVTLSDSGRLEPARECLERALALNAEFMPAHINLGRIYERLGNAAAAVIQWSAVLAKLAEVNGAAIGFKTTALNQTARALETANQDQAAESMLRQSLDIDCHQREVAQHFLALRQRQCEWPVVEPWDRVSREVLLRGISPLSAAAYTDDPLFQLAAASNYNQLDVGDPAGIMTSWPRAAEKSGRLRVGYLSSDLREHAVGYLMTEVFSLHDRSQVELFAYYCGPESRDPLHASFQASVDHWVSITGMDDAAAARRMAADGIQILVDLNGYTRDARVKLVALRPAPVIVNWLGYPGTMASPYHHYLIADDWIIPEENEIYFSEKVLRLPCYQPSFRKRAVAQAVPSRAAAGLPEKGMVYCCFNGAHKINRFTFDRWLTILDAVPGAVLWLLGGIEPTQERLRLYAARQGLAPERLVFAEKLANTFHLARYALADLFLDTSPYGAHTTGSDALFMGLPILTWTGRSFASRVCGSLVRAAGLPEFVCATADEYVARAIGFGKDPASLEPHRTRLRSERDRCPLFDTPLLVRRLEALFERMWAEYEAGTLPQPGLSHLDVYLELGSRDLHEQAETQRLADYRGWWLEKLRNRARVRPTDPDRRLAPE